MGKEELVDLQKYGADKDWYCTDDHCSKWMASYLQYYTSDFISSGHIDTMKAPHTT